MTPRQRKITATVVASVASTILAATIIGAARHEVSQDVHDTRQDSTLVSHDGRLDRLEDETKRLDSVAVAERRRSDSANAANVRRIVQAVCYRNPHPACDQ